MCISLRITKKFLLNSKISSNKKELIEFKSKTQDGSDNDYCNIKKISDGKYSFDGMTENKKYVYELTDKFYPALWWNHDSLLNNNYVLGQGCRNLKTQIIFLKLLKIYF